MSRGLRTGMSFAEWGKTFERDEEQQIIASWHARKLLGDDLTKALLAEIEYRLIQDWRKTSPMDVESQQETRIRLEGMMAFQNALQALANLEEFQEKSREAFQKD